MMELPPNSWARVRKLMVFGGKTLTFLPHQIISLWANTFLQWRDVILSLVSRKILGHESMLSPRNSSILDSYFSPKVVEAALVAKREVEKIHLIPSSLEQQPSVPAKGAKTLPS